jgi:hypothetical protein
MVLKKTRRKHFISHAVVNMRPGDLVATTFCVYANTKFKTLDPRCMLKICVEENEPMLIISVIDDAECLNDYVHVTMMIHSETKRSQLAFFRLSTQFHFSCRLISRSSDAPG